MDDFTAIDAKARASFASQTMMQTLGAELIETAPGRCVIRAPIAAHLRQQHGAAHAGLAFTIGDSAAGYAALRRFHEPSAAVMAPTPGVARDLDGRGFRNVRVWTRGVDRALFRPDGPAAPTDGLARPIFLNVGRVAVEKTNTVQLHQPGHLADGVVQQKFASDTQNQQVGVLSSCSLGHRPDRGVHSVLGSLHLDGRILGRGGGGGGGLLLRTFEDV